VEAVQGLESVVVEPPVPRSALLEAYRAADVLFLHLNDLPAFEKVLPSKIFEYAATGKPIVAGVGGFAADFLGEHVPGVYPFRPCDAYGMLDALSAAEAGPAVIDRSAFCAAYSRTSIMREMGAEVVETLTPLGGVSGVGAG